MKRKVKFADDKDYSDDNSQLSDNKSVISEKKDNKNEEDDEIMQQMKRDEEERQKINDDYLGEEIEKSDESFENKENQEQEDQEQEQEEEQLQEENLAEGTVTVLQKDQKDQFTIINEYYLKFLFAGKYLAFFHKKELTNIPIFYIKSMNIVKCESNYKKRDQEQILYIDFKNLDQELILKIDGQENQEKWHNDLQTMQTRYSDDDDKKEWDWQMSEVEVKYRLAINYEMSILKSNENYRTRYDYNKILINEYIDNIVDIFNYDPEKQNFEFREESKFTCYGQFKMIHKLIDPKEKKGKLTINASKVKSSNLNFGIILLSKQILQSEKVNYALCQKITSSKVMQKWMDFNYLYIFNYSKLKDKKKAVDEILPYQEIIDLNDWNEIKLIDANLMGFYLQSSKEQIFFVFNSVVECYLFYNFSLKAQQNIIEQYEMKKQKVAINIDFCELFIYQLQELEKNFRNIIKEIYKASTIPDKKKTFYNFTKKVNDFLIAFQAKLKLPLKCLALFLKTVQNFIFYKVTKIIVRGKFISPERVLSLINDMKNHEMVLVRWQIHDYKLNILIKVLQKIYLKIYFNDSAPYILEYFKKLKDSNYFYYSGIINISKLMIHFRSFINGKVEKMKQVKMNKDYILGVIELVRRFLYMILLNLEFLSTDINIKLEIDKFPTFLNSLLELQPRIDEVLKFLKQKFRLKNHTLRAYFSRAFIKKKVKIILHNFINLYQKLLTKQIVKFFEGLQSIEGFILSKYQQEHLTDNFNIQRKFLSPLYFIVEEALIYYSIGEYLRAVVRIYTDSSNVIDLLSLKKKLGEFQGKINSYKLNDKLLKGALAKMIKHIENFFLDKEEYIHYHFSNIALIYDFIGDYDTLVKIIKLRQFEMIKYQINLKRLLKQSIRNKQSLKISRQKKSRLRVIISLYCLIVNCQKKWIAKYAERYPDYQRVKNEDDEDDDEEEEEEEDEEEEENAPKEVTAQSIICRYFVYKKTTKKEYSYIKSKIVQLQFDPYFIKTSGGKLYMMNNKQNDVILKILMISRITFLEKFEKIYLTIYYKHNMMLILNFNSEKECDDYLKVLKKLVDYYVNFKFRIKKYEIIDKRNIQEDLKELFKFNFNLKYRFLFATSLLSNIKKCSFPYSKCFEFSGLPQISLEQLIEEKKQEALLEGKIFDEEEFIKEFKKTEIVKYKGEVKTKKKRIIQRRKKIQKWINKKQWKQLEK